MSSNPVQSLNASFASRTWFVPLVTVAVVAFILAWYHDTATSIVSIWYRSETFAHGFVVLPISLWLLWRERSRLLMQGFRPARLALLALIASGAMWLVGEAASVEVVAQFGLVGMMLTAVWSMWGHRAAWAAFFPLTFILFGVPFGEFMVPWLMQHTADFTISALRFSGIPVYREGLNFVIPTGNWSVVEACSGIRYLIASVMVGALFSYLNYRSAKRRLMFLLASIIVPLIANWLRAYMIVMLGYLSGNRLAVGVDHLIYGWVFFGIVIFALFWVGSLWREDDLSADPAALPINWGHVSTAAILRIAIVVIVCAAIWKPALTWLLDVPAPQNVTLNAPAAQGGWVQVATPAAQGWTPLYSGYVNDMTQSYRKGDAIVTLWIGYYAGQHQGSELVQWDNRVVSTTDKVWQTVDEHADTLAVGGSSQKALYSELNGPLRVSVWHWLWLGGSNESSDDGTTTISDDAAKLALVADRLTHRADDSAAIFLIVDKTATDNEARATVEDFLFAHRAAIDATLVAASNRAPSKK
ncbi:MAG TPA: exosortase A [Rhodocyclaceae bacterium]|nr:exosortase A [Rhodocyclaceae bacterium]